MKVYGVMSDFVLVLLSQLRGVGFGPCGIKHAE